jgi:hypothetical protein
VLSAISAALAPGSSSLTSALLPVCCAGQHVLSAVVDLLAGADTVSWELHPSDPDAAGDLETVAIDLNVPSLTAEQVGSLPVPDSLALAPALVALALMQRWPWWVDGIIYACLACLAQAGGGTLACGSCGACGGADRHCQVGRAAPASTTDCVIRLAGHSHKVM